MYCKVKDIFPPKIMSIIFNYIYAYEKSAFSNSYLNFDLMIDTYRNSYSRYLSIPTPPAHGYFDTKNHRRNSKVYFF